VAQVPYLRRRSCSGASPAHARVNQGWIILLVGGPQYFLSSGPNYDSNQIIETTMMKKAALYPPCCSCLIAVHGRRSFSHMPDWQAKTDPWVQEKVDQE
jgi:hypothetical protein